MQPAATAPQPQPTAETRTLTAADGGCFEVTLVPAASALQRPPIVFLPGMFSGRGFWLSDRGIGLAAHLAGHGFPGLIVQRRRNGPGRPGLEEHLQCDLPLVRDWVRSHWGQPAFWIGHSFGGVIASRAAAQLLEPEDLAGLVLFAAQFEDGKRMLDWPGNLLLAGFLRLRRRFPAPLLGMGPNDEPGAAMRDAMALVTRGRREPWLRSTLGRIRAPTLAIAGLGDTVDPPTGCEKLIAHFGSEDRRFIAAGRATGFREDYTHPGVVVSKPAQAEIWPLVTDWLLERAGPGPLRATE
ncbi:alpha/beta fold hydrolase [Aquisalimonas sp.]|uniref:alpha/beta fold hydrolase n=1 Tax=unclassified Aquisalimonas TaxID=2644645 RepID=UPI0025BF200B|nr:alpha/beta fold hydrolase [Aquisalimonas sp.]